MELRDLKVGDVVYGPLPHQDGWEKHYGVVLALDHVRDRALIASGTSRGVPLHDDGLRAGEVVVRTTSELAACGLRKPTRFDVLTHARWLESPAIAGLTHCGIVSKDAQLAQRFVSAWGFVLSQWRMHVAHRR